MGMLRRYGPELRPPKTSVLLARLPLRTSAPGLDGLTPAHVCAGTGWARLRLPTSVPGLRGLALCASAASENPRGARSTHRGSPDGVLAVLTGYYGVLTGVVRMEYSKSSQGYYEVLTGRVLSRWTAEGSAAARRQRCDVGARVRVEYPVSTL